MYRPSDPFCAVQIGTNSTHKTQDHRPRLSRAAAISPVAQEKQRLARFAGDQWPAVARARTYVFVKELHLLLWLPARRVPAVPLAVVLVVIRSCWRWNWRGGMGAVTGRSWCGTSEDRVQNAPRRLRFRS